jgi:transcriptional regulator with XRE-family HTH domain
MLKSIMVIKMLYKRIKELRKEKGITQVNVSTNIGVEESYYGKYERGVHDIPLSVLIKLADFYNVSLDYITERTNKREINK